MCSRAASTPRPAREIAPDRRRDFVGQIAARYVRCRGRRGSAPVASSEWRRISSRLRGYDSPMSRGEAQRRGRVLFLVENASVPTDTRVWSECLALQETGFDVTVICPEGIDRDTAKSEVLSGIEIH